MDYDSISKEIYANAKSDRALVLIDGFGKINHTISLALEGPNSIKGIISNSFRNSKIQLFDSETGLYTLSEDGTIHSKVPLPYNYLAISSQPGKVFNPWENELAYPRPINMDSVGGGMEWMAKNLYTLPILEVMDTLTQKIRYTMDFPQNSMYADGNFYFFPFPMVQQFGDRWYLYFWKELKYFVYKKEGEELVLEKAVDMNVEDAVLQTPLPFSQAEQYIQLTQNNKAGYIHQLYHFRGKTIVIYSKGIPEERVFLSQKNPSLELVDKTYAAVFDENNDLLKNDIPVPEGLFFSRAITENGEILAMKNQDYFGAEEDFVIVYKLKLLN